MKDLPNHPQEDLITTVLEGVRVVEDGCLPCKLVGDTKVKLPENCKFTLPEGTKLQGPDGLLILSKPTIVELFPRVKPTTDITDTTVLEKDDELEMVKYARAMLLAILKCQRRCGHWIYAEDDPTIAKNLRIVSDHIMAIYKEVLSINEVVRPQ